MTEREILERLLSIGAIIKDTHVVLTSGLHADTYVNKDSIYPHTQLTDWLCERMAQAIFELDIDVVVAPALGGIILSQWLAYHLSRLKGKEILATYAEKSSVEGGSFVLRRGYDSLISDKNVVVAEDILTTGGSVIKVIEAVRNHGGNVVGVSVLCNRGHVSRQALLGVPKLSALIQLDLKSWSAKDCPLCKRNIPLNTQVGKGIKS